MNNPYLAAIFAVTTLPGIANARSLPSTVPFELRHGHIFVQAFINGKGPYLFGFDTGASGMGRADVRLASELSLPKSGTAENSDGITTKPIDIVFADRLRLGPIERRHVHLLSRDYNGSNASPPFLMGLIGRDFFVHRTVTIDYPHRTLTFSNAVLRRSDEGVVPYGPSFSIPICFARNCSTGKVDTGSSGSIVVPKAMLEGITAEPPIHIGRGRRANSVSELYEVRTTVPIQVGALIVANPIVMYSDPSEAAINIGSDFLKDYVLTIDDRHHLLRITKPKS